MISSGILQGKRNKFEVIWSAHTAFLHWGADTLFQKSLWQTWPMTNQDSHGLFDKVQFEDKNSSINYLSYMYHTDIILYRGIGKDA